MKGQKVRQKGKIGLSKYFKKFKDKERVGVVKNLGVKTGFPKRLIGKSGKVIGSRGGYKMVEVKDGNKMKTFIIHPIHLKKLK